MTFLTDEVLSIVGTSTEPRRGLVTAYDIRKFATGIDDPDPLYTDPEAARAAGYADVISPPLFNAAVLRPTPFREGFLNDGQYETTAPPGLTHLQTMLAGQRWEIVRPSVAGEEIQEVFTTKSITEKQGKTGPIVFVEKESVVSTRDGEVIERYGSTLILREPPPPLPPYEGAGREGHPEGTPATAWEDGAMIKRPDMISLFLFVGAIWAVHRIHWDPPYAQKEGLPAPILPGWMLSSYLAQLARTRAPQGQRLHRIDVRYKAPVHPGDTLRCTAEPDSAGGGLALRMVNQNGLDNAGGTASFLPV
ncbi:MAG: MaoC family dehydratase N-terminal domain-containing protein [Novosphingobium sp.]|nr:MaoC family dehydratase N-terminal domain-containing protein [Novosphingobium sp.]